MSGIIKSGNLVDLSVVRPLSAQPVVALAVSKSRDDEDRDRLRHRIATLEAEVRECDEAIRALQSDVERAFKQGKEEGRNAGFAQAEDRQAERLSLLESGIRAAQTKLSEYVTSLDRLSVLLAQDCLDILLGSCADRADLVRRIIAAQVGHIDKSMLLEIEVSREDFPDGESLVTLSHKVDLPTGMLTAGPGLVSGDCMINLRLGRMNVGLRQQWGVLKDLLSQMALPEEAQ
jgi:flagellar biosynthesis/type III secretory pathway protein FliH